MEREECKSPDSYTFVTMVEKVVIDRDRKLEIYFRNGIKHSNLTSTEQWPFFAVVRELPIQIYGSILLLLNMLHILRSMLSEHGITWRGCR